MIQLNEQQIQRLYMAFDFEEYEEIVTANVESERGGYMEIHYIDNKDNSNGCYKPYFAKHSQEDKDKLDFILNGIKLERNPS